MSKNEEEGISKEEVDKEREKLKELDLEDKSKAGWDLLANLTKKKKED